jgi:hypothetical protein
MNCLVHRISIGIAKDSLPDLLSWLIRLLMYLLRSTFFASESTFHIQIFSRVGSGRGDDV